MAIWGRYKDGPAEKIDSGTSLYLLNEYRVAFGAGWSLWLGRKADEPRGK